MPSKMDLPLDRVIRGMEEVAPSHTPRNGRDQTAGPSLHEQPSHHTFTMTEITLTKLFTKTLSNLEEWELILLQKHTIFC